MASTENNELNVNEPASTETAEVLELPEPTELEVLAGERDQLKDQLLRTMADLQNVRRRAAEDRLSIQKFATEELVRDLLPVVDNFGRAVASAEAGATPEAIVEGVQMIQKQLQSVLENRNVRRIESVGQLFDPEFHEALGADITEDVPEGTVTLEIEAGYRMADRVIRPARVKVAKRS